MGVKKRICYFALLVLITMPAACSVAAITSLYYLPDSTFAEQQNNWQGRKEYDDGEGLYILVEFCVYDTENLLKPEEQQLADALDFSGRYIYAYQIWNHPSDSTEEVLAFQLLTAEKKVIPESAYKGDTGCHDDETAGVASTPKVSTKQGAWTFAPGDLKPNVHSWFLVFSSVFAPVKGEFKVVVPSGDTPVPPEVPEPGTIALLSVASGWFVAKRRKKRQAA
ncbi:MAG: PEP-CTERM sorting domain-containing protein [Sedimentisphaerales bacterium]|nr:PEP-CTERM sorting domain-containing protein [Sedimentisphaerales bacterium]